MIVTKFVSILSEVTTVRVSQAFSSTSPRRKPAHVRFYCFTFTFVIILRKSILSQRRRYSGGTLPSLVSL